MASPSQIKTSSDTNNITNTYFYYGTHPIKVPNHATYSNSVDYRASDLDDNSKRHLTNKHHGFGTSQSLHDMPQSQQDDETSEIFEDAVETLDDNNYNQTTKHNNHKRRSSIKPIDEPMIDLLQAFDDCEEVIRLFFQNHLNEAMQKVKELEHRSLYHALSHSVMSFTQAAMTFNSDDIERTIEILKRTMIMAKRFEPSKSWIPISFSSKPAMNEYELHAKLIYAEALLIRALLTFIQDQSLFSFISGAFKIKECHDIFVKLSKQNDPSCFSSNASYAHFDCGVRMGIGAFNLMISNLPQRIIRCLQFAGFSGNRDIGLKELEKSALSKGLRAPLAALLLLTFHTYVLQVLGNCDGDIDVCQALVDHYLNIFPNGYFFVFYRARLQTIHSRFDQAVLTYEYAISIQNDWKHLHQIGHWELLWCHLLQPNWKQAAKFAQLLLDENNWSKATYCFLLATILYEQNNRTVTKEIFDLYRRVPELKIRLAGKSIPLEKYAIRRCQYFFAQNWLFLPALEFIYLLNGFYIYAHDQNRLIATLNIVSNALNELENDHRNIQFYADSYGTGLLLRGVLLHFMGRYDDAHIAFDEIVRMAKEFDVKSFLVPTSLLEKALIYINLKQKHKAIECLQKSLNDYKNYELESRLQYRVNSAMQTAKQLDN